MCRYYGCEANLMVSVCITLCRWTATARLSMPLNDRGISDYTVSWRPIYFDESRIYCYNDSTVKSLCVVFFIRPVIFPLINFKYYLPMFRCYRLLSINHYCRYSQIMYSVLYASKSDSVSLLISYSVWYCDIHLHLFHPNVVAHDTQKIDNLLMFSSYCI
jgi:hypothetical protein